MAAWSSIVVKELQMIRAGKNKTLKGYGTKIC